MSIPVSLILNKRKYKMTSTQLRVISEIQEQLATLGLTVADVIDQLV